jgi:hypothetical protein
MHYDFIEIGTSDFDSLVETAPDDAVGLCVEPVATHLNKLPSRNGVKKINAAISTDGNDGMCQVFFVPPETIDLHGLPHWLRGCNSIGEPHPQHSNLSVLHLLQKDVVRKLSVATLLWENYVSSIDVLKIDTEGHDCSILKWFFIEVVKNKNLLPKRIVFENNSLTNQDDLSFVLRLFESIAPFSTLQHGDNMEMAFSS